MNRIHHMWSKNWPELWCGLNDGLPAFLFASSPERPGRSVPVFHYHIVTERGLATDLRFLKVNGYQTATADELLAHMHGRTPLQQDHVVLTFDDGPANLYDVAFPLLKQFGFRAIAFIAPGLHSQAPHGDRADRLCTWSEIEQMHDSGCVDFQSHTLEHRYIPHWPAPWPVTGADDALVDAMRGPARDMAEDFALAKSMLERRLGKPVRHLAFPNYRTNEAATRIAQQVGYVGLWHGVLPRRPGNAPGDSSSAIARVSGEFVRRLPGRGRRSLGGILRERYAASIRRWLNREPCPRRYADVPCATAEVGNA